MLVHIATRSVLVTEIVKMARVIVTGDGEGIFARFLVVPMTAVEMASVTERFTHVFVIPAGKQ